MRTAKINESLEKSISRERLQKYLQDQEDDIDRAISLYERNMQLSAAFYPELQALEVCLRNKIHTQMRIAYGAGWLRSTETPLEDSAKSAIQEAWDDLKKPNAEKTSGAVIAELKFSFWISLLGPKYDGSIWRQANHKAFPNFQGKRSQLQGRLNMLRRFRNRIAHHEPIYQKDLLLTHKELVEAIGWMCLDTQSWATHMSAVRRLLK